jgi:hypothetical protein
MLPYIINDTCTEFTPKPFNVYSMLPVNIEWFESKLCTCIIDDVWEHRVNIEWFESKLCTCIIDDVWEHRVNIEWFESKLCTCIIDDVWEHY